VIVTPPATGMVAEPSAFQTIRLPLRATAPGPDVTLGSVVTAASSRTSVMSSVTVGLTATAPVFSISTV
jgi:hypothetical protein